MAKGMRAPIEVGDNGGARMLEGASVVQQNIILALIPAGSLNPWTQDIAPKESLTFDPNDETTGGLYVQHVRNFFAEMERQGFARLLPGRDGVRIITGENNAQGNMDVIIRYVNLETGKEENLAFPLSSGAE